jgi:hypothetical protein
MTANNRYNPSYMFDIEKVDAIVDALLDKKKTASVSVEDILFAGLENVQRNYVSGRWPSRRQNGTTRRQTTLQNRVDVRLRSKSGVGAGIPKIYRACIYDANGYSTLYLGAVSAYSPDEAKEIAWTYYGVSLASLPDVSFDKNKLRIYYMGYGDWSAVSRVNVSMLSSVNERIQESTDAIKRHENMRVFFASVREQLLMEVTNG